MGEQARLVGREAAELAVLETEWQRAAGGELRCVVLSGDAGVGKTALAACVADRHADGAVVLSARTRPLGGVASFRLWAEALDAHLRDLPGDGSSGDPRHPKRGRHYGPLATDAGY